MVVNYFGKGSFRLQSGEVSILINPENNRLKADVVLKTISPAGSEAMAETGDAPIISFAGEYEVKGIEITGFPVVAESTEKFLKTTYVVTWEEMKIVLLGHLATP